jgi:CheY-like chemotaxis protein
MIKQKRILVVEDSEVMRKFLRAHLKKSGFEVVEAEDGVAATLKLEREHFDLIICDIMMPRKDGWELLNEVKSNPKTKDIPVIVLTARDKDAAGFLPDAPEE